MNAADVFPAGYNVLYYDLGYRAGIRQGLSDIPGAWLPAPGGSVRRLPADQGTFEGNRLVSCVLFFFGLIVVVNLSWEDWGELTESAALSHICVYF